jgi:hypothetical protein
MAINYVKGQILSSILERDGINIAIANANVGINKTSPTVALDVNGNVQANNISVIGNVAGGNLTIANTTIVATSANANITIQPSGTGLVTINTTTGLILPVGNTAQRPSPAVAGTVRYNTSISLPEFYDGTNWGAFNTGVTNQILNGDGATTAFTLNTVTTTAAVLIILNGITQVPGQAYNMSPNPSTNLVFTEAPGTGDVIDVRFL